MLDKLKLLLKKSHELGIPIPLLRDPIKKAPSVSLTLLMISFILCLVGLIGKWAHFLSVDTDQAIYLFLTCAGLYFSRSVSGKGGLALGTEQSTTEQKKES